MKAVLIAALSSGAGKTTVTLGLLRALRAQGVRSLKLGPDYIDPAFHAAATGRPAMNLDPWAMPEALQAALLSGDGPLVIESAMGLFDGAGLTGAGSAADVAARFDLPIVLVVDCAQSAQTLPALVEGVVAHRPGLRFHGLVLNNVGSPRHGDLLRAAFERAATPPILGLLPRKSGLALESRHLGLVQAQETEALDTKLDAMAAWLTEAAAPEALLAQWTTLEASWPCSDPPAQRIAIAKDAAFSFIYPHVLNSWRRSGASVSFFSPLADEIVPEADLIYLPGGYPELHAGRLAASSTFLESMRKAVQRSEIYGECGGYMVLGEALTDAEGTTHRMAGLLPVQTSFASRRLSLGYRRVRAEHGLFAGTWGAHEFHYSTATEGPGAPLFAAEDADGRALPAMGRRVGRVSGSYAHLIAPLDGAQMPA